MSSQRRQFPHAFTLRGALYRTMALALGLLPFVLLELTCMAMGWGKPEWHEDPFVGFSSHTRLFVRDPAAGEYRIPEPRYKFFYRESFPIEKPDGELRVFCLGGSTVQGRPFSTETAFSSWLELGIQAADPDRPCDVINCGGVSYASYRLVPVLEEVLDYEPDLIIVYTGHNEFLEERSYDHLKHRPAWWTATLSTAAQSRTFTVLRSQCSRLTRGAVQELDAKTVLSSDVEARLDYRDGMDDYHRDPAWRSHVVAHFRNNLVRMMQLCAERDVPLVFVNPVSNLRNTPPFKTEWDATLSPEQQRRCRQLFVRSRSANHHQAIELLQAASQIDPEHAGIHFALAKRYDFLRKFEDADRSYRQAKDYDVCPLRMLEPMHDILRRECRRHRVPMVDARARFETLSSDGIPGSNLLLDHVHPSIAGHQEIADALFEYLEGQQLIHVEAGWQARREQRFRSQLEELDDFYFLEGERRLQRLRRWAAGQGSLERDGSEADETKRDQ